MVLQLEAFEHLPMVEALQTRLAIKRGDEAPVLSWLGGGRAAAKRETGDHAHFVAVTEILARLIHSSPFSTETIEQLLDELRGATTPITSRQKRIEIELLTAALRNQQERSLASEPELLETLEVAARDGFIQVFRDCRPAVDPVLKELRSFERNRGWVDRVLSQEIPAKPLSSRAGASVLPASVPVPLELGTQRRSPHILEVLTEREEEVLYCLNEHLSNQEIADRLFISPLTVKRHASNIYDKLGVNSRRQALVRATELGFLEHR
jgi:LuxR family maltose regulon positive regulatory protein